MATQVALENLVLASRETPFRVVRRQVGGRARRQPDPTTRQKGASAVDPRPAVEVAHSSPYWARKAARSRNASPASAWCRARNSSKVSCQAAAWSAVLAVSTPVEIENAGLDRRAEPEERSGGARTLHVPMEIETSLRKPVVRRLIDLMRLRNSHPAFAGRARVETPTAQQLSISWSNADHWAKLDVDLKELRALITHSDVAGDSTVGTWDSQTSATASEAI